MQTQASATEASGSAQDVLASLRERVVAVAEAWLAAGAQGVSLWANGRTLAVWPAGATLVEDPDVRALLRVEGRAVGELRVCGMGGPAVQARLDLDARLVSHLAQVEGELGEMTSALIDAQDQLLALYDYAASARAHLAMPETLRAAASEAARLVVAEGAFALLAEPSRPLLVEHYPEPMVESRLLLGLLQQAQATNAGLVLSGDSAAAALGDLEGVRCLLFEPIRVQGQVVAGLGLLNKRNGGFRSPDLKLVQALSEHAGAQIENVMLYRETLEQARLQDEMAMAARIQLSLLPPRMPQVPGLDLHAHSQPALHVGGDFYDVLYLPDRPFVVAVGDVSGKGTSAALLMVMTRIAIHSKASYLPRPSPHEILARSSQDLYDDLARVNMFVTIFVGQYEPERQRLHYANMGHSPVVFCPACGPARLLRAEDPPLGVMPVDRPHSQVLDLQAGDLLLVATDGFCEARNTAGEMYGYDRILSLVESLTRSGASAGDVAQALRTSVAEFSAGCPQDDDQTLVALRVTGQPD